MGKTETKMRLREKKLPTIGKTCNDEIIPWLDINWLCNELLIKARAKEINGINETFTAVKRNYMCWKSFLSW